MIVEGKRPSLGLLMDLKEVSYHCPKALLRSKLWNPESWQPDSFPSRAANYKALERKEYSLAELED